MKRWFPFIAVILFVTLLGIACDMSSGNNSGIDSTRVALSVQQTSLAMQQNSDNQGGQPASDSELPIQPTYTLYPTYTSEVVDQPAEIPPTEEPTTQVAPTPTITQPVVQVELYQQVNTDKKIFYCVPSSGPTKLTVTVQMSDIDRGATLFWRLHDKGTGKKTDWEIVDMQRAGGDSRTFTFDADVWTGTNNFYYPPLMGESWFEFQIVSNDGLVRTEVFADVTFFPCAQ